MTPLHSQGPKIGENNVQLSFVGAELYFVPKLVAMAMGVGRE